MLRIVAAHKKETAKTLTASIYNLRKSLEDLTQRLKVSVEGVNERTLSHQTDARRISIRIDTLFPLDSREHKREKKFLFPGFCEMILGCFRQCWKVTKTLLFRIQILNFDVFFCNL